MITLPRYRYATQPTTVRCRYNAVNFLQNIHEMHPIDWHQAMIPATLEDTRYQITRPKIHQMCGVINF